MSQKSSPLPTDTFVFLFFPTHKKNEVLSQRTLAHLQTAPSPPTTQSLQKSQSQRNFYGHSKFLQNSNCKFGE